MPVAKPSIFQEYDFSSAELVEAKILSPVTKMWLQNELAVTMLRKVAVLQSPDRPREFDLFQAELDGRVAILSELLEVEPIKPSTKPQEN